MIKKALAVFFLNLNGKIRETAAIVNTMLIIGMGEKNSGIL